MPIKTILLKPKKLTSRILDDLEKKGLFRTLKPTAKILRDPQGDMVDTLYSSSAPYGTHKLICVRKNQTEIRLTTHPENEEVIFLSPKAKKFKPLYLVTALMQEDVFEKKAAAGKVTAKDVVALEVPFNDPSLSVFSVLKGTPHCEVTVAGSKEAPLFFVTEPTDMTMKYTYAASFQFKLAF